MRVVERPYPISHGVVLRQDRNLPTRARARREIPDQSQMQGRGRCRMLYVAGQLTQTPWGPLAERYEHGKRLRKKVPRERHAELLGAAARDPVAMLAGRDRSRVPELIPVGYEGMLIRPL